MTTPKAAADVTYCVTRMLAHIEKGDGRDAFGGTARIALCGARVLMTLRFAGDQVDLKDPMFYPVCGSCRRIQRQREARAARTSVR